MAATPESSADYLLRLNCKAMMEWLTARSILHRPDDPMQFLFDLLSEKLKERGGVGGYDPNAAITYLKESYDDAMSAADEHGIIHSAAMEKAQQDRREKIALLDQQRQSRGGAYHLDATAASSSADTGEAGAIKTPLSATGEGGAKEGEEAGQAPRSNPQDGDGETQASQSHILSTQEIDFLAELELPDDAAAHVSQIAASLVNATFTAYYHEDQTDGSLHLSTEEKVGEDKPRAQLGMGLVGIAAKTGDVVMVRDGPCDPRFVPETDAPNCEVGPVLCVPVYHQRVHREGREDGEDGEDGEGKAAALQGVLLVGRGPAATPFTERDARLLKQFCSTAGVVMKNANQFQHELRETHKFKAMIEIIGAINDDQEQVDHHMLLYTISIKLPMICDAHRCTVYLVDSGKQQLWAVQGGMNLKLPMDKGIAGHVATTGETVNVQDAYKSEHFFQDVDRENGYHSKAILAMPIWSTDATMAGGEAGGAAAAGGGGGGAGGAATTAAAAAAAAGGGGGGGGGAAAAAAAGGGGGGGGAGGEDAEGGEGTQQQQQQTVIGVVQLINKVAFGDIHGGSFTKQDEDIMKTYLSMVGPMLTNKIFPKKKANSTLPAAGKESRPTATSPAGGMKRIASHAANTNLQPIECGGDLEDEQEETITEAAGEGG